MMMRDEGCANENLGTRTTITLFLLQSVNTIQTKDGGSKFT